MHLAFDLIGGLEVAQVVSGQLHLSGGFWDYANGFNIKAGEFPAYLRCTI